MDLLLRRALDDPVFLRYRYRPHCDSHTTPTTTLTASTVTLTTVSAVESTTSDAATTLTFAENSTSVMLEASGSSRRWTTGEQFDKSGCVALNVSVGASLLVLLTWTVAV